MADAARKRMEDQVEFSPQAKRELSEMLDAVVTITTYALDMFSHNNQEHMQEILDLENKVDRMERELQESHIQRLTRNECTAEAGMMFSDLLSGLERVADHATNIAFSLTEEDKYRFCKKINNHLQPISFVLYWFRCESARIQRQESPTIS